MDAKGQKTSGKPSSTCNPTGTKSKSSGRLDKSRYLKRAPQSVRQKTSPTAIVKKEPPDTESPAAKELVSSQNKNGESTLSLDAQNNTPVDSLSNTPVSPNTVKTEPGMQSPAKGSSVSKDSGAKPKSGQKRGRIVPSRYLPKAEPNLSRGMSPSGKDTAKKESSNTRNRASPASKNYISSTPKVALSGSKTFVDGDLSSIAPVAVRSGVIPKVKTALGPAFNEARKVPSKFPNIGPVVAPRKPLQAATNATKPPQKKKAQATPDLNLLYSEEVLLAFNVQEAQEELEQAVKDNLKLLWALSHKNRSLLEKHTSLKMELQRKTHLLTTYKRLTEQKFLLETCVPNISEIQKELHSITTSIDQQQSETPMENLIVPENSEHLVPILKQVDDAMADILQKNDHLRDQLSELSNVAGQMRDALIAAENAKERCEELSTTTQDLSTKEQSVLIQRYQEGLNIDLDF